MLSAALDRPWLGCQLRLKTLPSAHQRDLLLALGPLNGAVLLNGDPTLADLCPGVHWTEARLYAATRAERPTTASVHDPKGAALAARLGVGALVFAPVWSPGSKTAPARGLNALAELCRATPLPVFALGGLNPQRAPAALRAGAAGVATLSALREQPDPSELIDALHAEVVQATGDAISPRQTLPR